jgi:hypothetical protein
MNNVTFFQHVTEATFNMARNKMKEKCEGATWGLILKFEN